jgi:2-hydroxycyclohexanecarboxyl-CoA dehydrogenase
MEMELENQRVIVFGAARGIGQAIANQFATESCRVVGVDRDRPVDSQDHPWEGFVESDVTSFEAMKSIAATYNDVEHVVFSVGLGSGKSGFPFWNLHPDDWSHVLEVNLLGAVNVAHAFAPMMANRRSGSFLFLVSVAGQIGSQTDPPYSASKAGLINFMQCAAKDLSPYRVRVNALSPGMVRTDLNQSVWQAWWQAVPEVKRVSYDEWAADKIQKVAPLGQWQTASEYASMAVYLASPHARNITGQTINIDGGQVMHA